MPTGKEKRRKLIQLIHIAAKDAHVCTQCGEIHFHAKCEKCGHSEFFDLDQQAYSAVLEGLVEKKSTADMNMSELKKVLNFFQERGFVIKNQVFNVKSELDREKKSVINAINERAPKVLGENYELRIKGFLSFLGRDSLEFCTMRDLRRIHGFLSSIERKTEAV